MPLFSFFPRRMPREGGPDERYFFSFPYGQKSRPSLPGPRRPRKRITSQFLSSSPPPRARSFPLVAVESRGSFRVLLSRLKRFFLFFWTACGTNQSILVFFPPLSWRVLEGRLSPPAIVSMPPRRMTSPCVRGRLLPPSSRAAAVRPTEAGQETRAVVFTATSPALSPSPLPPSRGRWDPAVFSYESERSRPSPLRGAHEASLGVEVELGALFS